MGLTQNSTSEQVHDCRNEIIDIRSDAKEINLLEVMKNSLRPTDGAAPQFPDLLLWDKEGLKGFEEVTYLDDYYLTHNELDLLKQHGNEIALNIKPKSVLIELGSGNLRKIKILLAAIDKLGRAADYYALDLNRSDLERSLTIVPPGTFQHITCRGLLGTYDDARTWLKLSGSVQKPTCIIFLGSSIGSFDRAEAAEFLAGFVDAAKSSSQGKTTEAELTLIVGLDACKSQEKLDRAYNDPHGVWNRFILNGLTHANALLGYEAFQKQDWTTTGSWNEESGCYERHLIPLKDVTFEQTCFRAGSKIFFSHSYKYSPSERTYLWEKSGLQERIQWATKDGDYGLSVLCPTRAVAKIGKERI